jgi:hypothetical protein
MTVGGYVYELPKLESPIAGIASSSSEPRLMPTPRTTDSHGSGEHGQGGKDLRTIVSEILPIPKDLLPTPSASNPNDGERPETWLRGAATLKEKHGNGNGAGMPLSIAVQLLPTPTVGDASSTANATAGRTNPDSKHHSGTTLTDAARLLEVQSESKLLPTPTARDGKDVGDLTKVPENSLLPRVIYNLPSRGESTNRPSDDGNPSSDQSPIPMTNEDDSLAA